MTSADSRCSFLAHRCARSRLLRQNNGSLRIRHAAFTQCKPNLPCALLTEYRAWASTAASPRALWPSIRFLFILSVFRLRLPPHPTLL